MRDQNEALRKLSAAQEIIDMGCTCSEAQSEIEGGHQPDCQGLVHAARYEKIAWENRS